MNKFKPGDSVVLSREGRREIKIWRRKRGVVVGEGIVPGIVAVEWGRYKVLWNNHEDNLKLAERRLGK